MATVIVFALPAWIESIGLYNMFICAGVLAFACYMTTIPILIWGRKWRVQTALKYEQLILRRGTHAITA
jgi:TRAP-type C4-dicarboxylate transport system permease large subunit